MKTNKICELCDRSVEIITRHHLIPKQKGTDNRTIGICHTCHRQLHTLFYNHKLKELDTLEKLKAQPEIHKFIKWVKNKRIENIKHSSKGGFHE